jgi:hypothetical protein
LRKRKIKKILFLKEKCKKVLFGKRERYNNRKENVVIYTRERTLPHRRSIQKVVR